MDELADSAGLADDGDGLRRRLAADGYLFFRGLLPADQMRAAGAAVMSRLRAGGWVDDRGIPSPVPAGLALYPRKELAAVPPGPSRFFAVHPRWQRWRPPPAVH